MDKRARSRSGSEEREVLQNRFRKIRKEKRSGVSFKRRYRSACLKLLTYFIRVLTAQTEHPDYDPYDPHSLYLERRKLQAEEQLKRVDNYQLPRKDQPLLARLEPVPNTQDENTGYYSEDSFVAETVDISDEEQEEIECPFGEPRFIEIFHRLVREGKIKKGKVVEPPHVPVVPELPDRLRGPSRVAPSGASSSILQSKPKASPSVPPTPVLQSKPKTATSVSSSGHRASAASSTTTGGVGVPEPLNPPTGVRVNQQKIRDLGFRISNLPTFKYSERLIFSVDWHQVLDTVRFRKETLRTDTYRILPEVQDSFHQLQDQFPGCLIVINSYCCSEFYRKGVASVNHPSVSHTITTEDRVNEKGKFSALTEIADDSCVLVHFDDSVDVVTEWRDLTARHNEQLGIFGIKVPRHWKTQRAVTGVDWYQNIVDAIQDVCTKYRLKESQ